MKQGFDVIVIGAGHNGLTAGATLARHGRRVLVLERRGVLGGLAAGEEFHPGYRTTGLLHDTTAVRKSVIRDLELERYGLVTAADPPRVFVPQLEGRGLLLASDAREAFDELFLISPHDARRYTEYREFIGRVRVFVADFFSRTPPSLESLNHGGPLALWREALGFRRLGRRDMLELLRIVPMSVADWLDEWFESDELKSLLAGRALLGSFAGPRSPGTAAALLIDACLARPAIVGGPQALVDALTRAASAHGVELRTEADVQRIRVAARRVTGVTLMGGETIDAPIVAATCDPRRTVLHLLAARDVPHTFAQRIRSFRVRGTVAKVHLALSGPLRFASRPDEAFEHIHIAGGLDDMERAFDAAKYRRCSETPLLDIHVPTVSQPALAPEGHCVVSILAHHAPYDLDGGWTFQQRKDLGHAVVDTLERFAPGVKDSIVAREVLTPDDLENRYGLSGGHVFHGEHALDQRLARPTPESAHYATPIAGLYFCGSGSHPGGGITCAPGTLAAAAILNSAAAGH